MKIDEFSKGYLPLTNTGLSDLIRGTSHLLPGLDKYQGRLVSIVEAAELDRLVELESRLLGQFQMGRHTLNVSFPILDSLSFSITQDLKTTNIKGEYHPPNWSVAAASSKYPEYLSITTSLKSQRGVDLGEMSVLGNWLVNEQKKDFRIRAYSYNSYSQHWSTLVPSVWQEGYFPEVNITYNFTDHDA